MLSSISLTELFQQTLSPISSNNAHIKNNADNGNWKNIYNYTETED